ncbi:hypothetical protein Pryu01_01782 [Paraliobacillus ryukyuensis]|uniref:Spore germination protein KA n=1 Tax=Paraliobacillus ryukyuensis TaxID=200904 RepID=A0A366E972_9BACI|nr:spore germination protein [Paraliobacillus ryukyuensis]RBO98299.1 spore germination protein KA [Paraliobacillus ryukyuensis]
MNKSKWNEKNKKKNKLTSRALYNEQLIKELLGNSTELVSKQVNLEEEESVTVVFLYMNGLVSQKLVQEIILEILLIDIGEAVPILSNKTKSKEDLYHELSIIANELTEVETIIDSLINGKTVLFIDGKIAAFSIDTKGSNTDRGVEQNTTQQVVRGPKDSFTESILINVALIRKRIKDPSLWTEQMVIGTKTQTQVMIAYIHDVVNEDLIKEVRSRLKKIKVDAILESGNIEEFIQDQTYTPFPTVYNSERPDAIAAGILEGRIAIFIDGTPFVLLVPVLLINFLQTPEDYYQRSDIATLLRCLRMLAVVLSLLTPSIYIALTVFHQEMIPTRLLISLAAQREGVPFPALVEALIMEVTFELLREAGIRLPATVGSAISIVGALVLGQAAVDAGIVSAMMVIVVSITAISSFVFPSYNFAISLRMLRFGFMILAATFGFFGIFTGLLLLVMHLSSLRSFGVPYLSPFAPYNSSDQEDAIFRVPIWLRDNRPKLINQKNIRRERSWKVNHKK